MLILRTQTFIPYVLLTVFFIPWGFFDLGQYEIKIKEITIFSIATILIIKHLVGKKIYIDNVGKIYFYFIIVCIIYTLIQLTYPATIQESYFVIHILIFTILNFMIYFITYNANLEKFNLKRFINFLIIIYIGLFSYLVYYAFEIHVLGQQHIGGFYSIENELWQKGKIIEYFGGTNSRSWFFLILSAFLVGYFKNRKLFIQALLVIFMSILVSYSLLSRGATLFGIILLIIYLLSFLRLNMVKLLKFFPFFLLSSFLIVAYTNYNSNNSLIMKTFEKKQGYSNRDQLVFDSVKIIANDWFIGRGFHYTNMNKDQLKKEGYKAIGQNNTQNTLLSIFIELGIMGIMLYVAFWILLYYKIIKLIKYSSFNLEQSYLSGIKFMIIFIFFSSIFVHFIEKSFITTPIYMVLIGLATKLKYQKTSYIN